MVFLKKRLYLDLSVPGGYDRKRTLTRKWSLGNGPLIAVFSLANTPNSNDFQNVFFVFKK